MEQTITQNGASYLAQHRARKRYVAAVATALWKQARDRIRAGVENFDLQIPEKDSEDESARKTMEDADRKPWPRVRGRPGPLQIDKSVRPVSLFVLIGVWLCSALAWSRGYIEKARLPKPQLQRPS